MPIFKYKVRDKSGKAIDGTIDAPTLQMAGERLYQVGYFPIAIEEERDSFSLSLSHMWQRSRKVKLEDLIFFNQQFSTLYKAGLSPLTGLKSIIEEVKNHKIKKALEGVRRQIEGGSTLHGAMVRYPDVFPPVYVSMVRAGEESGTLGEALDRFVTLGEREVRTRQRMKEVTRYPKIVVVSLVIAFGVLMTFVIPRFAQVFTTFNTSLPLPTRMMIWINDVVHTYWYLILGVLFGIPIMIRRYIRTEKGRYLWDHVKTRMPLFGSLFSKIALSRFSYIFVMLNRSGIPILQALEITATTADNVTFSESIERIRQEVKGGKSLTDAMRESGRFTSIAIQMASVGETSGTLDEMMMRVTEYYDLEVDNTLKKLPTYIEPTLTLFLGIVVLFLALAVFLPWWDMASLFK